MLNHKFNRISWWSLTAIFAVCLALPAWAQTAEMTVGEAIHHDTSPPMSHVTPFNAAAIGENKQIPIMERESYGRYPDLAEPDGGLQLKSSPAAQLSPTPAPIVSRSGLSDDDNATYVSTRIVPPDVNGDIGLDNEGNRIYVQYINLIWAVYNVNGDLIDGPFAGNSFWSGFGGPCEANNDGDPVVLYDDQAGQWFFSQFSINEGVQCVAISTTSDPLGPYHRYAFTVTPGGGNDYPKLGVWDDGAGQSAYTFTLRDFDPTFNTSAGVMERDQMLQGLPAQFVKFSNPCGADCIEGQLPPHLAGPTPPASTCPTYWAAVDAAYDDSPFPNDGYRNHTLCVDWSNTGSSTYIEGPIVPAGSNFDRFLGNGFSDCISPAGGGEILDCLAAFTMNRVQYRWFGSNASVVFNTTVDADDSNRAGIRWVETRSADGDSGWVLGQDGTYAPTDGLERWMGSIAQDQNGNMALGYSVTGASLIPAVRYTSRMAGDAAGTMPGGEVSCHEGTGVQTGSSNRWGDYSSMSIDPTDDCTFWYTQEYYETTGSFDFNTRICSFKLADCGASVECTVDADCDNGTFCDGAETCNTGTGQCEASPPVDCDDGTFCNGAETCNEVTENCDPGTPPTCDDGVGCTVDSCDTGTDSCDNVPNDTLCDNGAFCDGTETCDVVNDCQSGSNPCAIGEICDETDDICEPPPPVTEMHVGSVVTGTQAGSRGKKFGTATVTILDNNNNPVGADFTVTGDFSGSFTETDASADTESSGVAVIVTSDSKKKVGAPDFCVSNVSGGGLIYNEGANAPGTTCDAPPVCGNNTIELGEVCDGTDLGGESCVSQGFDNGVLACLSTCQDFDTTLCVGEPACEATHSKEKGPRCSDGLDNDCDLLIDGDDPDC